MDGDNRQQKDERNDRKSAPNKEAERPHLMELSETQTEVGPDWFLQKYNMQYKQKEKPKAVLREQYKHNKLITIMFC